MNRRNFLYNSGILAGTYLLAAPLVFRKGDDKKMSRIGLTTVNFRNRFRATAVDSLRDELKLTDIPEYYSDRFGIKNIEFWSKHFESFDKAYLNDIKTAISKSKSKLINIQGDSPFDMSDTDELRRETGIKEMKEWIDAAEFLGCKMVRFSIMRKSMEQAKLTIKLLLDYANGKGVTLLVENHNDLFSITENHIQMAREFASRDFGLIADFGNYREPLNRFDSLKAICPYTKLISAKVANFDNDYNHTSYDFDKCVRVMEDGGYRGIYSIEQYGTVPENGDMEKITDWAIERLKANI